MLYRFRSRSVIFFLLLACLTAHAAEREGDIFEERVVFSGGRFALFPRQIGNVDFLHGEKKPLIYANETLITRRNRRSVKKGW